MTNKMTKQQKETMDRVKKYYGNGKIKFYLEGENLVVEGENGGKMHYGKDGVVADMRNQ